MRVSKKSVLLNKTYPTDIKTIINLKKPIKPSLKLCLNSLTRVRCPLEPPLLPERLQRYLQTGYVLLNSAKKSNSFVSNNANQLQCTRFAETETGDRKKIAKTKKRETQSKATTATAATTATTATTTATASTSTTATPKFAPVAFFSLELVFIQSAPRCFPDRRLLGENFKV